MWISRDKWNALVARVEQLEQDTGMREFAGFVYAGRHTGLPVRISKVVSTIAEHVGLQVTPERPAEFTIVGRKKKK